MIKLKTLVKEGYYADKFDSPELKQWILANRMVTINDFLYHGSPLEGLKGMIENGIYGTEHGEVAEYNSFSTSFNSNILHYFSEDGSDTGLSFKANNVKVVVLDNILHFLVTQAGGSGIDIDVNEEELAKFARTFKLPMDRGEPYLPYGYLSSLGVDAFTFDYVWQRYSKGHPMPHNDESEVCFIGDSIDKLNSMVDEIYVDGNSYSLNEQAAAIEDIESRL